MLSDVAAPGDHARTLALVEAVLAALNRPAPGRSALQQALEIGAGALGLQGATVEADPVGGRFVPTLAACGRPPGPQATVLRLCSAGEEVGQLRLERDRPLDPAERATARLIAALLAPSVAAVRLQEAQRRQEERLRSLLEAARASVSSLALREVLQRVLAAVRDLFNATAAAAWWSDETGVLRRFGSVGLSEAYVRAVTSLDSADSITGLVVRSGRPVAVRDVSVEPRLQARELWAREGIRSLTSAPLFSRGRAVGALSVYHQEVRDFTAEEVDLLAGLASVAAAAIENALLHARTERALAEVSAQGELLNAVVENAQDGILAVDERWRVLLFSPGCERLLGWTAAEATGRPYWEVLRCRCDGAGPLVEEHCPLRPLVVHSGEPVPYVELLVRTRAGAERWIGLSIAPIAGRRAGGARAVMVLRDITAAKETDQMKSALLSTVSHELRTPLTAIRALSELLADHEFAAEQGRAMAATINRESERLDRLVANLLDAARLEAGRLPCEIRPLELAPIVAEAVAVFDRAQDRHTFVVDVPPDLPLVQGDPDRLRQILDNLLSNAVKYSPEGGLVGVRVERLGDEVRVSVSDEGVGIAPEVAPRLFERFHRAEGAARGVGGTGLGLYITRGLVELLGGRISVTSQPGRGATFTFTLPVAPEEPDACAEGQRG